MPEIWFTRSTPLPDGSSGPATGRFRFRPSRALVIPGTPDTVIVPEPFTLPLTAGVLTVDLAPTQAGWAWRVDESVDGVKDLTYYVTVPDVPGPLDDPDLPRVDQYSLAPQAAPVAAWWAVADQTITTAAVVGPDLVLTRFDGSTINAGAVRVTDAEIIAAVTAAAPENAVTLLTDTDGRPYIA